MKFDLNNKTNRFAKRTLAAFSSTLMQMLETKRFEEITVNALCTECDYPRATFYNYFDDSYDLLNYCWIVMMSEIDIHDYLGMDPDERVFIIFERMYDYFSKCQKRLDRIMKNNTPDGMLAISFNLFVKQQTNQMMSDCPYVTEYKVPQELMAEHYGNTIQLMVEWCFLRKKITSKDEAIKYLRYLLGNLE